MSASGTYSVELNVQAKHTMTESWGGAWEQS